MLETLEQSPESLIKYASSRLNAELLYFLREVKSWREHWSSTTKAWLLPSNQKDRASCYKHAALIYFKLVNERAAVFPINISYANRKALDDVFKYTRYQPTANNMQTNRMRNDLTPWDSVMDTTAPEAMVSIIVNTSAPCKTVCDLMALSRAT